MEQQSLAINSLYCGLCRQVLDKPEISPCGHSYCFGCVTSLGSKCSTCKHQISKFTVRDYTVASIIETIQSQLTTKEDFVFHIECSLCKELFDSPMINNCGHTFCYTCCFHIKHRLRACPICRTEIWRIWSNNVLAQFINEVKDIKNFSQVILTV